MATLVDDAARLTQLVERLGNKTLATEAGVDRHQQHHVHLVDDVFQVIERCCRVEHQARLAAAIVDQ